MDFSNVDFTLNPKKKKKGMFDDVDFTSNQDFQELDPITSELSQNEDKQSFLGGLGSSLSDAGTATLANVNPIDIQGSEEQPRGIFSQQDQSLEGTLTKKLDIPQMFDMKASARDLAEGKARNKDANPLTNIAMDIIKDESMSTGKKLKELQKVFPGSKVDVKNEEAFITLKNGVTMKVFQNTRSNVKHKQREFDIELFDFNSIPTFSTESAAASAGFMLANDKDAEKNILKNNIPGSKFAQDKFGNWIIDYEDKNGKRVLAYVNPKGFTSQDAGKFIVQGGIFARTAGLSGLVQSQLKKILIASSAAGATSASIDKTAELLGSETGVDPVRTVLATFFGGLGEGLAPFFGKFFKSKKFVDDNGQVTEAGKREAKDAGIDVEDLQKSINDTFDGLTDDLVNANTNQTKRFEIPLTRGQATGSPRDQAKEELIRGGAFGEKSQKIVQGFDEKQNAVITGKVDDAQGLFATDKLQKFADVDEVSKFTTEGLRKISDKLKLQIDEAYDKAGSFSLAFKKESFDDFTNIINKEFKTGFTGKDGVLSRVNTNIIDRDLSPGTTKALDALSKLNKELQSKVGQKATRILDSSGKPFLSEGTQKWQGIDLGGLSNYRRKLNNILNSKLNSNDKRQVVLIKRALDNWMDKAVDGALLSGDPAALEALKKATSLRANYGRKFEQQVNRSGKTDAVGKKLEELVKDDINDGQLVSWIFGNGQIGNNQASITMIKRIREIVGQNSPEFEALKQAAFIRLQKDVIKNGKFSKAKFVTNVRKALDGNGSATMNQLFSGQERSVIRQLAKEIQRANPAMLNPSGTTRGLAVLFSTIIERIGAAKILSGVVSANPAAAAQGGGFIVASKIHKYFSSRAARGLTSGVKGKGVLPDQLKAIPNALIIPGQ